MAKLRSSKSSKIQSRHWSIPTQSQSTIPTCCLVSPESVGPLSPVVAFRQFDLHDRSETTCRVDARTKWMMLHPLRISDSMQSGVSGRDGCTQSVGPHKSKDRMQMRRRSRVSRARCTHAQQSGQTDYNTGYSHGDRPLWRSQMFITPVTSFQVNVRGNINVQHLRVPSSHVRSEAENA